MPEFIEINDLNAPGCEVFTKLTEAQLRNRLEPEKGIFIAESPKVIERALTLFRDEGIAGERFSDTVSRLGFENVQKRLLGE